MADKTETDEAPHRRDSDRAQSRAALHIPRLVQSREVHADVHGSSAVWQFNSRLAVLITKSVGTMGAAYVFTALAVGGAGARVANQAFRSAGTSLVSHTSLQLVLPPLL